MNYLTATPDFDRFFSNFFVTNNNGHREAPASLPVKTTEEDEQYILKAEVPGLTQDDITIEFKDGNMTINASYETIDEKDGSVLAFRSGSFTRTFDVRDIDSEKVYAEIKDGILTLTLPKKEDALPKQITIKSA